MALQVYRYANYLTTDEREQFRSLCKLLSKSKDDYILVANPIIGGRELDALLIKRDAIIVLEFKNYTGSLTASEFGDWHITTDEGAEVIVKGGFGNKNPYVQVTHNKWSVVNKFKDELNSPLVNAYHVSGIVVFKGNITENKFDFSPKVRTWFRIADMTNVIETIENIASPKIDFNDALWNELPKFLNVEDYLWTDYEQTTSEISVNNNNEVETCQDEKVLAEESSLSVRNEKDIKSIIVANGFKICKEKREDKRDAISVSYSDLNLSKQSVAFLKGKDINTLWEHQYLAIKKAKEGKNLCITTSTSSGKTEIFQIVAIEKLKESPDSKILAIYPMKALNRQQLERWEKTGFKVGKIDGDVTDSETRKTVLQNSQIVVATPDVIHAFLLGRLNDNTVGKVIQDFIKSVSLVVIDELHLFKGVFGTNSAYLFRRFNNIRRLLKRKSKDFAQYITASATLPNAIEHSFNITGVTGFEEISIQQDASPMAEKVFYFVEQDDTDADVVNMVYDFSTVDDAKSITFVEGRQRAGEMAHRIGQMVSENAADSGIYPYRSGYETESVNVITEKLNKGNFKGVISTSALEIGIDIDGLNIAIIADMPYDKNSYMQRVGRVGRYGCEKSYVIVVKTSSFASQLLFDEQKYNYDIDKVLPNYEPALYLEDKTVQNIHALCHVGNTDYCEYAKWRKEFNQAQQFDDGGCFPSSFAKLCQDILTGQESKDYQAKENNLVGAPQIAYPLRFISDIYKILPVKGEKNFIPRESITREQVVTEGYEGAVRNTLYKGEHIRERVRYINFPKKEINVAREWNDYLSTSPQISRYIIPNFNKDFRYRTIYFGDAKIYNLSVKECYNIYGYWENHNKKREYFRYKSSNGDAKILKIPPFPTTGVVFFHPSLNAQGVNRQDIATILFEVFLRLRAFERNDINYRGGRLFNSNDILKRDDCFIAIYDANDLNLTSRALDEHLLKQIFEYITDNMGVITASVCPNITSETVDALNDLCQSVLNNEADLAYKELGKERKFKTGTEVIYRMSSKDDPEAFEEIKCIFIGKGENETYYILLNGKPVPNIPIDSIEPTENTEYE
jgi:DEAD/DEAH box helicase domain-containing protein